MDNKPTEKLGENFIKSRLLKYDFDVHSELSYDRNGADLIITQKLDDTKLQYIKIQSKARKIKVSANIKIPISYVNQNFVLFVYLIDENKEEYLFCFFEEDFKKFLTKENFYVLNIYKSTINIKLSEFYFNENKAIKLRILFDRFKKKNFTSVIIDGFFLKESIKTTQEFYSSYWKRKFSKPSLHEIVKNILIKYNRFDNNENDIACYLYISNNHDLEDYIEIDNRQYNFVLTDKSSVKIFISYSNDSISHQIMDDINRYKNSNNIILVANDIVYESFLQELNKEVEEIIIMRLKIKERTNEMFVKYKWGDISDPIGISLGLQQYEI